MKHTTQVVIAIAALSASSFSFNANAELGAVQIKHKAEAMAKVDVLRSSKAACGSFKTPVMNQYSTQMQYFLEDQGAADGSWYKNHYNMFYKIHLRKVNRNGGMTKSECVKSDDWYTFAVNGLADLGYGKRIAVKGQLTAAEKKAAHEARLARDWKANADRKASINRKHNQAVAANKKAIQKVKQAAATDTPTSELYGAVAAYGLKCQGVDPKVLQTYINVFDENEELTFDMSKADNFRDEVLRGMDGMYGNCEHMDVSYDKMVELNKEYDTFSLSDGLALGLGIGIGLLGN